MAQSKRESLTEAITGTMIGFVVSLAAQFVIFPMNGFNPPVSTHLWIMFWFTVIAIARSYIVRRAFESKFWKRFVK